MDDLPVDILGNTLLLGDKVVCDRGGPYTVIDICWNKFARLESPSGSDSRLISSKYVLRADSIDHSTLQVNDVVFLYDWFYLGLVVEVSDKVVFRKFSKSNMTVSCSIEHVCKVSANKVLLAMISGVPSVKYNA